MDKVKTTDRSSSRQSNWQSFGLIFFCFVAGFFGSWAFNSSDLAGQSGGIAELRQRVISEGEVVADIAKEVSPSVVSIVTETTRGGSDIFGGSRNYTQEGAGTGIIISADGYILTNKHVIPEGASDLTVIDHQGKSYDRVEVIGRDPLNDLAFLKIQAEDELQPAKLGSSSSINIGQRVVAIGNALGQFESSVTSGIISGVNRSVMAAGGDGAAESLINLLQTDAAINPGNSGGPLVSMSGEVVGINTAVSQGAEGIGFAIPIDDAKGLIRGVLEDGEVARSYIGVRYVTITPEAKQQYGLNQDNGAYILGNQSQNGVIDGSPADKAGLRSGDIIIKIGDKQLTQRQNLSSIMSQYIPGEKVKIGFVRDGQSRTVDLTVGQLD